MPSHELYELTFSFFRFLFFILIIFVFETNKKTESPYQGNCLSTENIKAPDIRYPCTRHHGEQQTVGEIRKYFHCGVCITILLFGSPPTYD